MTNEYEWPWEIRSAVEAFKSNAEWTILAAVIDEPRTIEELQEILDEPNARSVDVAVSNLAEGGLVSKRNDGPVSDPYAYFVQITEYGERFAVALFDTLGEVDAPRNK